MKDLAPEMPLDQEPPSNPHRNDTSLAAKKSIETRLTALHEVVLKFFYATPGGGTYADVMAACSMQAPTATGRLNELVKAEFIRDSKRRAILPSKRKGRVYEITAKGVARYNEMMREG